MKKFILIASIWGVCLLTMITCNSKSEITFTIHYDTNTKQTYQLKDEIQQVYSQLVSGIHEESYILMVIHNLKQFEVHDNVVVSYENNQLNVKEGDGKGDTIYGELTTQSVCLPQVQPRSFIKELLTNK